MTSIAPHNSDRLLKLGRQKGAETPQGVMPADGTFAAIAPARKSRLLPASLAVSFIVSIPEFWSIQQSVQNGQPHGRPDAALRLRGGPPAVLLVPFQAAAR